MAETKEGVLDTAARALKAVGDFMLGKKGEDTKLAADAQTLTVKDGDPIVADADGAVTSGQADGDYVLEDGSTVTITDGKLGEIQPAKTEDAAAADDKNAEADKAAAETDAAKSEEEKAKADEAAAADSGKEGEADKPVTQADLKTLADTLAQIQAQITDLVQASKEELSAVETKLNAELDAVKRSPAVGKQGPVTHTHTEDLSKLSTADRAARFIATL